MNDLWCVRVWLIPVFIALLAAYNDEENDNKFYRVVFVLLMLVDVSVFVVSFL